jgi:hypothetical protein
MAQKPIKLFLIKIVPLFLVTLLVWQRFGISQHYHSVVAAFFDLVHPVLDPTGLISGVTAKGSSFLVGILSQGRSATLEITAEDITSNTAMLLALFLASPVRPHVKAFLLYLFASLLALLVIHVLTVATTIQYAFMIGKVHEFSASATKFYRSYTFFYERFGMFLFVLALWFPYITFTVARANRVENK